MKKWMLCERALHVADVLPHQALTAELNRTVPILLPRAAARIGLGQKVTRRSRALASPELQPGANKAQNRPARQTF